MSEFTQNYLQSPSMGFASIGSLPKIKKWRFTRTTPPSLSSSSYIHLNTDTVIIVPYSANHTVLNAYKEANNWSALADYIYEERPDYIIPETVK